MIYAILITDGTQACYKMLSDAMNELHTLAMNQTLDIDIGGDIHELNSSSAMADSSVSCSSGMVSVRYYCSEWWLFYLLFSFYTMSICAVDFDFVYFMSLIVPCAPGRYLKNNECIKCDYGNYQDSSGQLSCKKCPDDTTTPGRESRGVTECSVKLYNDIYGITCSIIFCRCILSNF